MFKNKTLRLMGVILTLLTASCGTRYQAADESVLSNIGLTNTLGYKDYQIDSQTFSISFIGNGFTNPSSVFNYTLTRAAEVASKNGFPYFVVISQRDRTEIFADSNGVIHKSPGLTIHIQGKHENCSIETYEAKQILQNK
jgi:hypothetical protein